jgi:predicted Rossmann fold nucleotide-binding protein DprA/Smf involved in DNA uptake
MEIRDYLSDDGQTVLALCTSLALPPHEETIGGAPFTLSEWNKLERQIENSALKQPAALQGLDAGEIKAKLNIEGDDAERIVRLLERTGRVSLELERLFSGGIWAVTRLDAQYPQKLLNTLKHQAPSVLFGSGDIHLLKRNSVAVVGSRNLDEAGIEFARATGRKAVESKLAVVSGGARGSDRLAMEGALEAGGVALGALADSLEASIRKADVREFILDGRLVMVTMYAPNAGFSVGAAMGRNKVIYGLSDFAVIVSSDLQTGGTWAGAREALKAGWCPVFVRDGEKMPKGNEALIKLGAVPFPEAEFKELTNLASWMKQNAKTRPVEQDLFST